MQINKELSHLTEHFLEAKAPEKKSLVKGSLVRHNGFIPFALGVNVGWIILLFLWKLCIKQAEKSGLTLSDWIGQKLFSVTRPEKAAHFEKPIHAAPEKASSSNALQASSVSSPVAKASQKKSKEAEKPKKTVAKKTKTSAKKAVAKKAAKAEKKSSKPVSLEKKAAKKTVKATKTVKKATEAASKAKKKVKTSEDKA